MDCGADLEKCHVYFLTTQMEKCFPPLPIYFEGSRNGNVVDASLLLYARRAGLPCDSYGKNGCVALLRQRLFLHSVHFLRPRARRWRHTLPSIIAISSS